MSLDITVITPSLPSRSEMLFEAMASVANQTVEVSAHLVRSQRPPDGVLSAVHIAAQRNALLAAVKTEWVATLDDDDLYAPGHFAAIAETLSDETVDVAYTFGEGRGAPRVDVSEWTNGELAERLTRGNCISSNAAVRVSALRDVGGWNEDPASFQSGMYVPTKATWEDWDLWSRLARGQLAAAGAGDTASERCRFRCVPEVTWSYRSGDWAKCTG